MSKLVNGFRFGSVRYGSKDKVGKVETSIGKKMAIIRVFAQGKWNYSGFAMPDTIKYRRDMEGRKNGRKRKKRTRDRKRNNSFIKWKWQK